MIPGNGWGPSFPLICLTVDEKPWKKKQENWPDRESNSCQLGERYRCYPSQIIYRLSAAFFTGCLWKLWLWFNAGIFWVMLSINRYELFLWCLNPLLPELRKKYLKKFFFDIILFRMGKNIWFFSKSLIKKKYSAKAMSGLPGELSEELVT